MGFQIKDPAIHIPGQNFKDTNIIIAMSYPDVSKGWQIAKQTIKLFETLLNYECHFSRRIFWHES